MSTATHEAVSTALPVSDGSVTDAAVTDAAPRKRAPSTPKTPEFKTAHGSWQVVLLPVERIDANPWQPRTFFEPQEMEELTQSVKAHGVQQPVIVRSVKPKPTQAPAKKPTKPTPPRFELVAGERRLRASQSAGKKTIPAIVRDDLSDLQVAEMALLENVQRSNLSVIEEARGYRRLMLEFRLSEERLAKKVGKSVAVVRDLMKLLALPEGVQGLIRLRKLAPAHGHELLRLSASPEVCNSVAAYALHQGLPATALAKGPLPNARELEKKGLVMPLDYRTRFDTALCKACPHKAHVASGYAAYCLKPEEWRCKQEEALQRQRDDNARVLEEARRSSQTEEGAGDVVPGHEHADATSIPFLTQLPHGSYRDLRFGRVPTGCSSACPCRGVALKAARAEEGENGSSEAERVAVCLNPARYDELQKQVRLGREQQRQQHFATRLEGALQVLQNAWQQGHNAQAMAIAFTPFLDGRSPRSVYLAPGQWQLLLEQVNLRLQLEVPLERVFDEDTDDGETLRLLAAQDTGAEHERPDPVRLVLLGAGGLLALEAHSAARWGGETPLLDFVLPPETEAQTSLELESEDEGDPLNDEDDPFMEEDFGQACPGCATRPADDEPYCFPNSCGNHETNELPA